MKSIEIDSGSGFCFGVVKAIRKAEEQLESQGQLYCLGDIVHNTIEVERLREKGLQTLTHEQMEHLHDAHVLFRAHGEPPSTYELARKNRLEVIDATCPVVLHLQQRIKKIFQERGQDVQLLIFGKAGHAEVNGLVGQTENHAIVLEKLSDIGKIDPSKDCVLFSQTTQSKQDYDVLIEAISKHLQPGVSFEHFDTVCRHFGNRIPQIREFASRHDCILFVSDAKSSNGKALLNACRQINSNTHFVSGPEDLKAEWFDGLDSVGICGATSTPVWLMEQVRDAVRNIGPANPERHGKA